METFKITTDETLRETIQHGNNRYPFAYYPDNIWKFDFHRIDWHWHHELEFLYTAEGTALCLIGTSKIELHKGCGNPKALSFTSCKASSPMCMWGSSTL